MLINKDFRGKILIYPYYLWIHWAIFISFWVPYHFYSTGIFLSKLYILLKMTTWFSTDFSMEAQALLKKTPSKRMVLHVLKQFSIFYQLNQQLNRHLNHSFLLMVMFFFTYGLHAFYLGFYVEFHELIKYLIYLICIDIILILSYFSVVAGAVDVQSKRLSDCVYRVAVIEHRFYLNNCYTQVLLSTLFFNQLTGTSFFSFCCKDSQLFRMC